MRKAGATVLWLLLVAGAMGHHGPEDVIAELSAQLAKRPDDPVLLSRRATEYRALGMHAQAEADLRKVLAKDPDSVADMESLARVLWVQGRPEPALTMIGRATELAEPGRERAACLILGAEWEMAQGRLEAAEDSCDAAFDQDPGGMVDWYLLRGRIQECLGKAAERVAGLKAGHEASGSVVLRNAWVDASLDAGMVEAVSPLIEAELGTARLKSSWLIRRGRVCLGSDAKEDGRADLRAAIAELDQRIHAERPDVKLLLDRGWAYFWIGDVEAARVDLALARKHGGDPWELERLAGKIEE